MRSAVGLTRCSWDLFQRSVWEHGQHIATNMEWSDELRGNHYLADVVGLLFVAAYLPPSPVTDTWLRFACREVIAEIRIQFLDDGGNFEGSTSYHRLSLELAAYGTALMLALPEHRVKALTAAPSRAPHRVEFQAHHSARWCSTNRAAAVRSCLRMCSNASPGARSFCIDITKPDCRVPQFGDNDNGRFFNLVPSVGLVDGVWVENHLDHRAAVAAVAGLLGIPPEGSLSDSVARAVTAGLARPPAGWGQLGPSRADRVRAGDENSWRSLDRRLKSVSRDQIRTMRGKLPFRMLGPMCDCSATLHLVHT